jgi:hypothetical protein
MKHIAEKFSAGEFSAPILIRNQVSIRQLSIWSCLLSRSLRMHSSNSLLATSSQHSWFEVANHQLPFGINDQLKQHLEVNGEA